MNKPRRAKESSRAVKFIILMCLINMHECGNGGIRIAAKQDGFCRTCGSLAHQVGEHLIATYNDHRIGRVRPLD
jgi:hypothetical protein